MSNTPGRIPEVAFKSVSGILFGMAMIAAASRTVLRIRSHGRLFADDIFLLFACACLTAATVIIYRTSSRLFLQPVDWLLMRPDVLQSNVVSFQRMVFTYISLTWAVIFSVKFSFLCFFKVLTNQLRRLLIYWRVVVGVTVVSFCFCISEAAIECPHFDISSFQCGVGSGLDRSLKVTAAAICLDIITDVMMIAILLHLLWKVKMKLKQKLGLGLFLCLSIFMVITAIVRISALRHTTHALGAAIDAIDVTWKLFWQQVEACIAVLMVSFTAFRSIFMAESSKNRDKEAKPWYSTRQRILRLRRKAASDEQSENSLPAIPGATLTGMRTFIRGGQDTSTTRSETVYAESSDGRPLPKHPEEV